MREKYGKGSGFEARQPLWKYNQYTLTHSASYINHVNPVITAKDQGGYM